MTAYTPDMAASYDPSKPLIPKVGTTTQQQAGTFDSFDPSKLSGTYADMYKNQQQQTQQQNARNLNYASRQANRQAALKGWNPAMAASYVNQAMSGAYDANRQANENLMNRETELKKEQNAEREKQIDWLMSNGFDDFATREKLKNMGMGNEGSIDTLMASRKSDSEKALEAKVQELMLYNPSLSQEQAMEMVRQQNRNTLDKEYRESRAVQILNNASEQAKNGKVDVNTIDDIAKSWQSSDAVEKQGLISAAGKNDMGSIYNNKAAFYKMADTPMGTLLTIDGTPYILAGKGDSSYAKFNRQNYTVLNLLTGQYETRQANYKV